MATTLVDDPRDRAFERMYERYVRDVYHFVLALLRNPADAEDVTQTTFMNAYRAIQAGEQPRRPQNWLMTIAHNTARSRVRQAMRRPREVPLDEVVNELSMPDSERTNVRELLRALGRLPFNQRAAITMRELEGRSYEEIAETLDVSVSAVEALIARARRSMRLQAAAFRGLTVIGLPRSLRRLISDGEAVAGSAIGAGVVAKAAAIVVAGVVAGGLGYASVEAGTPSVKVVPRLQPRPHFAPEAARAHHARPFVALTRAASSGGHAHPRGRPGGSVHGPLPMSDAAVGTVDPTPVSAHATEPQAAPPVEPVQATVAAATATVPAGPAPVPAPVSTQVVTVAVPAAPVPVPDLPVLPQLP